MKSPLLAATLFAGILLLSGCGKPAGDEKKAPLPVVGVEEIRPVPFARELALTGEVVPVRVAKLSSFAEGPVTFAGVREGDRVEAGTKLFVIGRSASAEAALVSSLEELRKREAEFQRASALRNTGAISVEQLDVARSELERARAAAAAAHQQSEDYTIHAPWSGVVGAILAREGNYVPPRTTLAELYDPASLVLRFAVPEEEALRVAPGMRLKVTFDAYPGETFDLEVSRAYGEIDRALRLRTFEAGLTPDRTFLLGMFARLRLAVESLPEAITVPETALLKDDAGRFVFVVCDSKAARRGVEVAFVQDGRAVISSGLAAGEVVVVAGKETIRAGAAVRVQKADKPSASQ